MPVNIIDTLKPKNSLGFPVVEAVDVAVEGYTSLADAVTHFATDDMISAINAALAGKANATDVTTSVDNLQGQIDQIVVSASAESVVAPEVAAARVDTDGTSHDTLKSRLDWEQIKQGAVLRCINGESIDTTYSAATFQNSTTDTRTNLQILISEKNSGSVYLEPLARLDVSQAGKYEVSFKTDSRTFTHIIIFHNGKSRNIDIATIAISDKNVSYKLTLNVLSCDPTTENGIYLTDIFVFKNIEKSLQNVDARLAGIETQLPIDEINSDVKTSILNGEQFADLWTASNKFVNVTTDTRDNLYLFIKEYNGSTFVNTLKQVQITSTGLQTIFFRTDIHEFTKIQIVHNGSSSDIPIAEVAMSDTETSYCLSFDVQGYNPKVVGGIILKNIALYKKNVSLSELNNVNSRLNKIDTITPYKFTGEYKGVPKSYNHETSDISDIFSLDGKAINLVGDSMTANQATAKELDPNFITFADYVKAKYPNCNVRLYGYGGSTIAVNENSASVGHSFVERILQTDQTNPITTEADVWIIWGGYNDVDWQVLTPVGTINENPVDTGNLYGALRTILDNIQERTNLPRIILVAPHQSYGYIRNQPGTPDRCRELRECFDRIGEAYSCQVVDLWKVAGITNHNGKLLLKDSLHLNQDGYLMCYPHILRALENLFN